MANIRPDALRYIQCELPIEVERLLIAFDDEISKEFQDYENRIDKYIAEEVPILTAALDEQADVRDKIIEGSPTEELASMSNMEDSIGLISPKKKNTDEASNTLDEMKLGAVGIASINGKLFKKIDTLGANGEGKVEALRRMWEAVSGDYEAFIVLGDGLVAANPGEFSVVQSNIFKTNFPFISKNFTELGTRASDFYSQTNLRTTKLAAPTVATSFLSQFRNSLIWTEYLTPSQTSNAKLRSIGYTESQVSNIFNRRHPNGFFPKRGELIKIENGLKKFTRLVLTPFESELRKPLWDNEFNLMLNVLKTYIEYRYNKNFKSSVLDPEFWEAIKTVFDAKDFKELLEKRIDIQGLQIPTSEEELSELINESVDVPSGSNLFHTYLAKYLRKDSDLKLEAKIKEVSLQFWKVLKLDGKESHAKIIEQLILELTGKASLTLNDVPACTPVASPKEAKEILKESPNTGSNLTSQLNTEITSNKHPCLASAAISASVTSVSIETEEKVTTGLPTSDSAASLLSRLVKWDKNFSECGTTKKIKKTNMDESLLDTTPSPGNFDTDFSAIKEKRIFSNGNKFNMTQVNKDSNEIKITNHKYRRDARVVFSSSGSLPGGIAADVPYYILKPERDSFKISTKIGGVSVDLTSKGTGIHLVQEEIIVSKAKQRRTVVTSQNAPRAKVQGNYEVMCKPKFENWFTRILDKLAKKLSAWLIRIINIIKQILISIQDKVDKLIAKVQVILDKVLVRLERLLTFDMNIGGKIGLDTSLIKCSWNLDFNLNFDLFGLLLTLLNKLFRTFGASIRKGLDFMQEFLTNIICVPIRLIERFLGGANALLGLIGCSLKDINLPTEILDLMKLLMFSFDLRGLVLRKGYEAFNGMTLNLKQQRNAFKGLSQFGSLCQKVSMKDALNALDEGLLKIAVAAPLKASDAIGQSIEKGLSAAVGGAL